MKHLTNALPIVAAAYGRKFGVSVRVGGATACTDGNTIEIPAIGEDPIAETLAWGYLAHEAAHIRHTDFAAWQRMATQESPLTVAIANILEDVRIENALTRPYPGTRGTLDAVMEWLSADNAVAAPRETDTPAQVLGNGLLVLARHRYRRQACLGPHAQEAERVMRKVFPPSCVHRLLGLMAEIPLAQSTADAAALARRIVALIEEEAQEPPPSESAPSPSSRSSESSEGGGKGDSEGDGRQEGNRDQSCGTTSGGGQPSSGQRAPQDGDQAPRPGEGGEDQGAVDGHADPGQEGAARAPEGAGTETDAQARRQALRAVLAAGRDAFEDPFEAVAEALRRQSPQSASDVLLPVVEQYQGHPANGIDAMRRVKAESAKLSARLQGLVQAKTMSQVSTVRQGRALSTAHLHRAAVGDSRIFAVRRQQRAPNTAIHLLVDLSGSMMGGQDATALGAALALAMALEPIRGVTCAVTAFPGLREEVGRVTRILSHGDRVTARAGAFVQWARGGTPMTGALWFAAADLLARREARRVILTLTDGEPDDPKSAREMVVKAKDAGLEMIGIGIGTGASVAALFPVAVAIQSVSDLKGALFDIAEQLLIT